MERIGSWDLVEHFFDASVSQERLDELIAGWDAQIGEAGAPEAQRLAEVAGPVFARQVAVVLEILEQLQAAETQRIHDLLSEVRTAALVLTGDGEVVAANEPARIAFGSVPGSSIRAMPFDTAEIDRLAARLGEVAGSGGEGEGIVQLRSRGADRMVMMHLKPVASGPSRSRVLAITSELVWPERVSELLARAFGLTPAEVEVLRLLSAGSTVGGIAAATGRRAGTVRV